MHQHDVRYWIEVRNGDGYQRLAAYYSRKGFKDYVFLLRHIDMIAGVVEADCLNRLYNGAIYVLYRLPLLSGYQSSINTHSCITEKAMRVELVPKLTREVKESGYHDA